LIEKPEAQEFYTRVVNSFRLSRAVWLAAHFRLADIIGPGPASAAEVAQASRTDPRAVKRLLDALTAAGLFSDDGQGRYGPTPPLTCCDRITRSLSVACWMSCLVASTMRRGALWTMRCAPVKLASRHTMARHGLTTTRLIPRPVVRSPKP